MQARQSLPSLWLLSDARNDAGLAQTLAQMPPGSGFVFRHYHLAGDARRARYDELAALARTHHHTVIVTRAPAAQWGADGTYAAPDQLPPASAHHLRLATAHNGGQLQAAERAGADGVFLSPVFATRSHPGATTLGVHGFHVLAMQTALPVIALGGMTMVRAQELDWPRWGAIDGPVRDSV